ncbi:unnamed protein product [Clonostachys rhizophaga]|uniref:Kinesin-like protein n=1 Tax=Clonostachys rhizophaga TaxID=160324 RepID=A0A9N9W1P2_9HYPO|nr:unnamed protein product [Clonostachys rhizophaga]
MEAAHRSSASSHNLFEVYLRLRPPPSNGTATERILTVETREGEHDEQGDDINLGTSHIVLNPPTDRRRAIEKFAFTRVFEEDASQLDVFHRADILPMVEGVLAPNGGEGTDAMVATLGVTGSGKTHTILGSKTQRGITQLSLDVIFSSLGDNMIDEDNLLAVTDSLQACDASESTLYSAAQFLDALYEPQHMTRSRAATPMIGESHGFMSPPPAARRNLHRISNAPQTPDVSHISVACDTSSEYAVVVSMYEVHNDRIYDLLCPPSKAASSKDMRRRPLLFKSTEMSPDRKVVAGLRKVVCATLKDAIMVLEAGLQERRVAGTGSNSTSSRSHGFFSFEVKKRSRSRRAGSWGGSRFTVVDLAGSERARDAKTAGATLVEAGKINESLMYLGQCLQTQSEANTNKQSNVIPYRQCKLTELLFSNSFPSASAQSHGVRRNPQRGIMIVTADPLGDFNATSQILRYSALAREVTVPRIPSITATILANPPVPANNPTSPVHQHHPRPFVPPGCSTSYRTVSAGERETMELAALEIARLSDDLDQLRAELEHQVEARTTAEAHLLSMEDRMLDLEADIRDDCASEFEQRLALEIARFKASFAVEQERNEEHWDRKVDLLERGLDIDPSGQDGDKENVLVENLEEEVERLRRENGILKRELASRSPTKRRPLEERDDFSAGSSPHHAHSSALDTSVSNIGRKLERMRVSSTKSQQAGTSSSRNPAAVASGSPKKVRRPANKRWEAEDELQ